MTHRERMEARAERRREWAESRSAKEAQTRAGYQGILAMIPEGQPVLVGHHSERRHRRDLARVDSLLGQTVEHGRMAERHESAADELDRQLRTSIYDDDVDAVERLREKLETLEAKRARMKADNTEFRKVNRAALAGMTAYERDCAVPHASYELSNLTGVIGTTRKRLERLEREAAAKAAGTFRVHYRQMTARYGGTCDRCGAAVEKGETMFWNRRADERMLCSGCGREA